MNVENETKKLLTIKRREGDEDKRYTVVSQYNHDTV